MNSIKWLAMQGLVLAVSIFYSAHSAAKDGETAKPAVGNSNPASESASSSAPPAEITSDGYKLVWHDEFNKDGPLNPADWAIEQGFRRTRIGRRFAARCASVGAGGM